MAANESTIGILRVLLSMNTAEFDKGVASSLKSAKALQKGVDEVAAGFGALGGEGTALGSALDSVSSSIGAVVKGVGALGPAGAVAAVGVVAVSAGVAALAVASIEAGSKIVDLTLDAAKLGGELFDLSNKTGISVEALSELKFIGEQAGVPLDAITNSVFKLGQNLSSGTDKVKGALHTLGLSLDEVRKLSPDKALELVLQRMHDLPDAGQRAAVGVALIGKGFKDVANLAKEDIGGLIKQAHDLGVVMSTEFAVAGDRFGDAMDAIRSQIDGVKAKVGGVLLPVAIALAETISKTLAEAFKTAGASAGDFAEKAQDVAVRIAQWGVAIVATIAEIAADMASWVATTLMGFAGLVSGAASVVNAFGAIARVSETMQLQSHEGSDEAKAMGASMKGWAHDTEDAAHAALVGLDKFRTTVKDTAFSIATGLPSALATVRSEISKTADEMRKGQADATGFGAAVGDAQSEIQKAAEKASKDMALLSEQIDSARTAGMSAGDEITTFGKDAVKAMEAAAKAGVPVADNVRDVAQSLHDLVKSEYYAKLADQARAGNLKIIAEADKRQQKELEDLGKLFVANQDYESHKVDLYRTGADAVIAQIERELDAQLRALPAETAANKAFLDERKRQLTEAANWRISAAKGMYHTLAELERASGEQTVDDLKETAEKSRLLYEQMRDSGAFSADAVQRAWEASVKAQAAAVGGLTGDVLLWYGSLSSELSTTLADMATHWSNWRDDLKKLWADIAGDFTKMLAGMLKRWIEGFLIKMLDAITGSRGEFASAWSSVLPGAGGGGGGGWGGLLGHLFGGGGAATGAVVGGTGVEAGIPMWSAAAGAGTPVAGYGGAGAGGTTGGMLGSFMQYAGGGLMTAAGVYSLIKAQTRTQNVIGGAETGAGIGTMILPGIGTIVGAGIGALGGLIKSFFGVSQQEKQGRSTVADFQASTFGGLTAEQRAGAQQAVTSGGWTDASAAGTLIAVRDAYLAIGKTAQDAERDVKAMWDAEKKGPDAVAAAIQPMQDALDAYQKKQQETTDATAAATDAQTQSYADMRAEIEAGMADVSAQIIDVLGSDMPTATKQALLQTLQIQRAEYERALAGLATDAGVAGTVSGTAFGTKFGGQIQTVLGRLELPTVDVPVRYAATNSLEDLQRNATGAAVPVQVNIDALDGASVQRVVQSPAFNQALSQQLPTMLSDNIGASRTNTRIALGVP